MCLMITWPVKYCQILIITHQDFRFETKRLILVEKWNYGHFFVISYVKNCFFTKNRKFVINLRNLAAETQTWVSRHNSRRFRDRVEKVAVVCHFICQNDIIISVIMWASFFALNVVTQIVLKRLKVATNCSKLY